MELVTLELSQFFLFFRFSVFPTFFIMAKLETLISHRLLIFTPYTLLIWICSTRLTWGRRTAEKTLVLGSAKRFFQILNFVELTFSRNSLVCITGTTSNFVDFLLDHKYISTVIFENIIYDGFRIPWRIIITSSEFSSKYFHSRYSSDKYSNEFTLIALLIFDVNWPFEDDITTTLTNNHIRSHIS